MFSTNLLCISKSKVPYTLSNEARGVRDMELFAVWTDVMDKEEATQFNRCVKKETRGTNISKRGFRFFFKHESDRAVWSVRGNEDHPEYRRLYPYVLQLFATGLAAYIIDHKQPKLLDHLVVKLCSDMTEVQKEVLLHRHIPIYMNRPEHFYDVKQQIKNRLIKEIMEAATDTPFFSLEGLMNFRIRNYKNLLTDRVERAIHEFWIKEQHDEVTSLLKHFVYFQEAKVSFVHLFHKGTCEFDLADKNMISIPIDQTEQIVVEMTDTDIQLQDKMVSTLIAISPKHILLHTQYPESDIVQTIKSIFEDRLKLCYGCRTCMTLIPNMQT